MFTKEIVRQSVNEFAKELLGIARELLDNLLMIDKGIC